MAFRGAHKRAEVLRQATAPETNPRLDIGMLADTPVEVERFRHLRDVSPCPLADVGDLIDEADARRQVRIGRILRDLSRLQVGDDDLAVQRVVELRRTRAAVRIRGADDHAFRPHEVVHRMPFAQELRIGDNGHFHIRVLLMKLDSKQGVCAHGYRASGDNERTRFEERAHVSKRRIEHREVRIAVAARRCRHAQEHRVCNRHSVTKLCRE